MLVGGENPSVAEALALASLLTREHDMLVQQGRNEEAWGTRWKLILLGRAIEAAQNSTDIADGWWTGWGKNKEEAESESEE